MYSIRSFDATLKSFGRIRTDFFLSQEESNIFTLRYALTSNRRRREIRKHFDEEAVNGIYGLLDHIKSYM